MTNEDPQPSPDPPRQDEQPQNRKRQKPPLFVEAGSPEHKWEQWRRDHPAAIEYMEATRGCSAADMAAMPMEIVTGQEAAKRLGLNRNESLGQSRYVLLLIDPNCSTYCHAIGFRFRGGTLENRIKRTSTKGVHEQDYIFLPHKSGQPYESLPVSVKVVICESAIKGLTAWRAGYIAVIMNGADGWSRGNKQPVKGMAHPVFRQGRDVVLLTDSLNFRNERSARNVQRAQRVHMTRLRASGVDSAKLFTADPPPPPEGTPEWEKGDEGIDSVFVRGGLPAVIKIVNNAPPAEFISEVEERCEEISEHYIWVDDLGRGIDRRHGTVLDKQTLVESLAQTTYAEVDAKGKVTIKEAYHAWRRWRGRPHVRNVRFLPGQGQLIEPSHPEDDRKDFNLWTGFAVEPWTEQSDIDTARENFEKHYVEVMFEAVGQQEGMATLDILAHMVQHPEQIQNQFIYACGPAGAGKSYLFMRPMKILLGKHCAEATIHQYTNNFNKMLTMARGVVINEGASEAHAALTKDQAEQFSVMLKKEADAAELKRSIEPKGRDTIIVDKCALAVALGNHLPNFSLDDAIARRMLFLLFSTRTMMKEAGGEKTQEWWAPHWDWMNSPRAGPDLITCLLTWDWRREGYTATGHSYQTQAFKNQLFQQAFSSAEEFARELRRDPRETLVRVGISEELAGQVTHVTASDIVSLFKLINPTSPITSVGLGKKLGTIFGLNGSQQLNGRWAGGWHPKKAGSMDGKPRNEFCWTWAPLPDEFKKDQFNPIDRLRAEILELARSPRF